MPPVLASPLALLACLVLSDATDAGSLGIVPGNLSPLSAAAR